MEVTDSEDRTSSNTDPVVVIYTVEESPGRSKFKKTLNMDSQGTNYRRHSSVHTESLSLSFF